MKIRSGTGRGLLTAGIGAALAATALVGGAPSPAADRAGDLRGYVMSTPVAKGAGAKDQGSEAEAKARGPRTGDRTPRQIGDTRWETIEKCQKDADPGEQDWAHPKVSERYARYSSCRVVRASYILENANHQPQAYVKFRVTTIENANRPNKKVTKKVFLDQFGLPLPAPGAIDPEAVKKIEDAPLTLRVKCKGIKGSTCNGKSEYEPLNLTYEVATWRVKSHLGPLDAAFDMSDTRVTNPSEPRAAGYYDIDTVSIHDFEDQLIGGSLTPGEEPATFKSGLRCDNAFYVASTGGCVWLDAPLVWYLDPAKNEYVNHVINAQDNPRSTHPLGSSFPRIQIPGSNKPNTPSSQKWLSRLYVPSDPDPKSTRFTAALNYYDRTNAVKESGCAPLPGGGGTQCDEYPMASTWQGAYYGVKHYSEHWRYSLKKIDKNQNRDAGGDFKQWMRDMRVLSPVDETQLFNDGFTVGVLEPTPARTARIDAERRDDRARAKAPIPADDICTDRIGGRYSCSYGEEWNLYTTGSIERWVIGTDRQVWHTWVTPEGKWASWQAMPGVQAASGVEMISEKGGDVTLEVKGTDDRSWYAERDARTGRWTAWHH
ncbi:hypothetical protein [Streptomyces sp. NPDC059788]|uniref:hypothetical protein n=1 Tax=Streptomyces sp. NPDC059788 TaxID=3346948 RepID=UPI003668491F